MSLPSFQHKKFTELKKESQKNRDLSKLSVN